MSFDEKVLEIRELLQKAKNPIIFFDTDTDGTTSYLQLKKAFPKLKGFYLFKESRDQALEKIKPKNDLILFFDIAYIEKEVFERLKGKKIVWADHHLTNSRELIKKFNIISLNPLNFDKKDNRPSCFLAYKIARLNENLPLLALGSVADFFLLDEIIEFSKEFPQEFKILFDLKKKDKKELFEFIKKYKFNDGRVKKKRDFWIRYLTYQCKLTEFKDLIDLLFKLKGDGEIEKGIRIIEKLDIKEIDIKIINGRGFLFKDYRELKIKYEKVIEKTNNIKNQDLVLFEYGGDTSFTKQLSELLSYKLTKYKIIFVVFKKEEKDYYSFSIRSSKIDLNIMLKKTINGLSGRGGGHKFACGGSINKSDFKKLIKRIKKYLSAN